MKNLFYSAVVGVSFAGLTLAANADTVVVKGTDDPWLAGQPNGTSASTGDGVGDYAPAQSPILAGTVSAGQTINWTASGLEANGPGYIEVGPNGDTANLNGFGLINHDAGAQNGISDILNIPVDSLIGVFLGPGVPSGAAPSALDFGSLGLGYGSLSPVVDQVFYLGDGSANSIVVPSGATRLYLGVMDGYGWDNNIGSFTVNLTNVTATAPDAGSTMAMLGAAFGVAGLSVAKSAKLVWE